MQEIKTGMQEIKTGCGDRGGGKEREMRVRAGGEGVPHIHMLALTGGQAPPANVVASSKSHRPREAEGGPWSNWKAPVQGQTQPGPLSVASRVITNPSHSTPLNSRLPRSPPQNLPDARRTELCSLSPSIVPLGQFCTQF